MKPPRPKQVDTKGTLARVERNANIARAAGARVRREHPGLNMPVGSPRDRMRELLLPDERAACAEMSPGLWIKCFSEGWRGMTGE